MPSITKIATGAGQDAGAPFNGGFANESLARVATSDATAGGSGTYATAAPGKNQEFASVWPFVFGSTDVPDNASVDSVTVKVQWKVSTTSSVAEIRSSLFADSAQAAALSAVPGVARTSEPTVDTDDTYTASTLPDISQLRNGLWVRVQALRGNSNTAVTFSLDYIQVTVAYTVLPVQGSLSVAGAGTLGLAAATSYAGSLAVAGSGAVTFDGTVTPAGGGGTTYAADDFSDPQTNTWASADVGGSWTTSGGAAGDYQKTGSVGTHALATASTRASKLTSVSAGDQDGTLDVAASDITAASSQGIFWRIETRIDAGGTNSYRIEIRISGTGAVNVLIRKVAAGSATTLRTDSNVLTGVAANDFMRFRWQIENSGSDVNLRYKLWDVTRGDTEPASFSTDYVDAAPGSPWTDPGSFSVTSQVSANFTGSFPVTLSYDNLSVASIGGGGGTTQNGTISVTGTGALSLAASVTEAGELDVAGAGTATLAGGLTVGGSESFTGTGALGQTGRLTVGGALSVAGSGALSMSPTVTRGASLAVTGTGALGPNGTVAYAAALAVAGSGALSEAPTMTYGGAWSQAAAGSLALTPTRTTFGGLSVAGAGSFSANGVETYGGALAVLGSGFFSGNPGAGGPVAGSIAVTGSGAFSAAGMVTLAGSASLTGSGALGLSSSVLRPAALSVAGSGALALPLAGKMAGTLAIAGAGSITLTTTGSVAGSLSLAGAGVFVATPALALGGTLAIAGAGTMTETGTIGRGGSLTLAGTGALAASGGIRLTGAWSQTGVAFVALGASLRIADTIGLVGAGSLSLDANVGLPYVPLTDVVGRVTLGGLSATVSAERVDVRPGGLTAQVTKA